MASYANRAKSFALSMVSVLWNRFLQRLLLIFVLNATVETLRDVFV